MRPNILFILVDGLRADQCYGEDKESHTPFLDSLINEGVYFNNAFSPADGTIISLNCLLNSKFQFETSIRAQKIIFSLNILLLYMSRYIHQANPKLPIYMDMRFQTFKNIVSIGYIDNAYLDEKANKSF